jgi:hypothetical protein
MYCVACGSLLPNEAQFCPRCGKRNDPVGVATDASPSGELSQTASVTDKNNDMLEPQSEERSEDRQAPETGAITDGTGLANSPEGGEPRQFVWESLEPENTRPAASTAPVTEEAKSPSRYANAGSITLGTVALICLVLSAIQGFIPIFLIEGAVFGGLAWLCAAMWPLSQSLHSVVLIASLLLAGLVGVTLDQDTFGPRYRYLSQGSTELRIDEKAGRTDRLGSSEWHPVAFDRAAEQLPPSNVSVFDFTLKDGHWGPNWPNGDEICFTFENPSVYVIQKLPVQIEVKDKDGKEVKDASQIIDLAKEGGGLIDTGETSKVCAHAPGTFPEGGNWSYTDVQAYGWKR